MYKKNLLAFRWFGVGIDQFIIDSLDFGLFNVTCGSARVRVSGAEPCRWLWTFFLRNMQFCEFVCVGVCRCSLNQGENASAQSNAEDTNMHNNLINIIAQVIYLQ